MDALRRFQHWHNKTLEITRSQDVDRSVCPWNYSEGARGGTPLLESGVVLLAEERFTAWPLLSRSTAPVTPSTTKFHIEGHQYYNGRVTHADG